MKRFTQISWTHKVTVLVAILAMLAVPLVALADEVYADGDGVTPVSQHPLHFGDVCADTSVSDTALLAIFRNGNANSDKVFANSSTVAVSINSVTGSGLSAAMNDSSIVLPSDWVSNGSLSSDTAQATVTLDASGLPLGSYSGKIVFQADGPNAAPPPASYSDTDQMPVDANIVDCAPSNTAPEVAADNDPVTVDEGDTAANTGTYSDADGDTVTLSASVGDIVDNLDGTWSWSFSTTDGPDESQTVTIYANDGQDTSSVSFDLTVNNVAPTIALSGATNVDEGSPYALNLGAVTDPGDDTVSTYTIYWGDGASDSFSGVPSGSKTHTYADGPNSYNVTVDLIDEDGTFADAGSQAVTVDNVKPTVSATADDSTLFEGDTLTGSGSFTDPGADVWSATVDYGDGSGVQSLTLNVDKTFSLSHLYADDDADDTYTVTVCVNDEDPGAGGCTSFNVTVANVAPTVAKPSFALTPINCQTSVNLTGISFSDPGVNDANWIVNIDWGDGSTDTNYDATTQGAQAPQSHTYSSGGTFIATVTVTDKDGGAGSNTSSNTITVIQYALDFLPPFDDSTPSGLIVNKMKNGRVVPVKVTIYDYCAAAYLTDPNANVTIKVTKTSGTTGISDPVEEYADAGQSSGTTNAFRWADGFWIYNLDSKALGLVVNNFYRVDVYVGLVKATVSNWAVLQPVK
jgi:hypothetical protein